MLKGSGPAAGRSGADGDEDAEDEDGEEDEGVEDHAKACRASMMFSLRCRFSVGAAVGFRRLCFLAG